MWQSITIKNVRQREVGRKVSAYWSSPSKANTSFRCFVRFPLECKHIIIKWVRCDTFHYLFGAARALHTAGVRWAHDEASFNPIRLQLYRFYYNNMTAWNLWTHKSHSISEMFPFEILSLTFAGILFCFTYCRRIFTYRYLSLETSTAIFRRR